VIEENWTEEEREMVEEWEKKGILLFTKDFWHWEANKQDNFLDDLYQKHIKEGKRKGYWLFKHLQG
jgi:predicted class III extradiol MEMO1 family dioxygenase